MVGVDAGEFTDMRVGVVEVPEHIDAVAPARSKPALRLSVMPLLATCPVEVAAYITGIGHVDVTAMPHNAELDRDLNGISFAALFVSTSRTALQVPSWVFAPRDGGDFGHLSTNLRVPDNLIAYMAGSRTANSVI